MSDRVSQKELDSVLALSGLERVKHFVKRAADLETVWGLRATDGWVSGDFGSGENPAFPVWPHAEYASACATGAWSSASPEPIGLEEFLGEWLPEMARKRVPVAVFPTPQGTAVTMLALELSAALEEELDNY